MDLSKYRFAETHEWARLDGDLCTVGISQFAVEQLTDVTYLKLPAVGAKLTAKTSFGEIESVKAVSDLYAPVGGEVAEVNKVAADEPGVVAQDPYGAGWLIKLRVAPGTSLAHLMTPEKYEEQIASEGH
jgi:glycine cleavage system H protein